MRNAWDAVITAVVVAAAVFLVVWLVHSYPHDPKDTVSILGVVLPAFTLLAGAAVGYRGGHATGRTAGRQELKQPLLARIAALDPTSAALGTINTHAVSPPGSDRLFLASDFSHQRVDLGPADALALSDKIADLRNYVDAL